MAEAQTSGKKPAEVKKTGEKKPNIFVRLFKKMKEVFSELKKVTWPTIGKTVKQTGIVIAVVLFFLLAIMLFDAGLSFLFRLLTDQTASITSLLSSFLF